MGTKDKRIDAYIAKSADFAKPVLKHLRSLVHKACPDTVETIKWSFPHFDYKDEMLCSMAAFKEHCVFGFWKASLMKDPVLMANARSETAMGHLGRITSLKDLPPDKKITAYIKEAMKLNDAGIKIEKTKTGKAKPLKEHLAFLAAVKKNKKALQSYQAFSQSNKNDYLEWFNDAKSDDTRERRIKQAIEWMEEGKPRNWKYMKEYR